MNNNLGPAKNLGIPQVDFPTLIGKGISALFLITGALSVIFVIVGALMFALSAGDPGRVKSARETIIYALVGLVISVSAFALVSFITGKLLG